MKKPQLSIWQIWNMSFGFLGIQFGFALQNANVSRIFETLGASIDEIPILWIAAPVTGLIVQPIIGYMSDKTWNRFGRRRPFFLVGAILASLALFVMPNSPTLWVAAGMLWIMDASINISMEPFRAFVGDMLPSNQRTVGFSMQSFFIGTGAVVASALPYIMTNWFGISNTAPDGIIPESVKYSFYIGGLAFFLAVLWTVVKTKEYSPEELSAFEEEENSVSFQKDSAHNDKRYSKQFMRNGIIWTITGILFYVIFELYIYMDYGLLVFFLGISVFGIIQITTSFLSRKEKSNSGLVSVITDLYQMPKTMIQLSYVQFFSWFALFAMWIYTTPAVTNHVYGTTDTTSLSYNIGADWVGILMSAYNGIAALAAFLLVWMANRMERKKVHSISLILGGLGLASFYFIKTPELLLVSEIGIGIAWASILSIPYAILTGSLPQKKLGVYMGIFNFFIVIPQITAAAILGFMVKSVFGGDAIYALLLGGLSMFIAAFIMLRVDDID